MQLFTLLLTLSTYCLSYPILNGPASSFSIKELLLPLVDIAPTQPLNDNLKGRRVFWSTKSSDGDIVFAKVLLSASFNNPLIRVIGSGEIPSGNIVEAKCLGDIVRPRMDFSPLISETNIISCTVLFDNDVEAEIILDLSSEPIYRWGNQFYPKGFSLKRDLAKTLFTAFRDNYEMLLSHDTFSYEDVKLVTPVVIYEFEDYKIYYEPYLDDYGQKRGTVVLSCTKEFLYAPNEVRPLNPTEVRCDFVYQWTYIPNSE